jgi:hypothetical protein
LIPENRSYRNQSTGTLGVEIVSGALSLPSIPIRRHARVLLPSGETGAFVTIRRPLPFTIMAGDARRHGSH